MKINKLQNNLGIGTKIKVVHKTGDVTIQTILSLSTTGRWYTDRGYYISKDFTIKGQKGIIATWKPIIHFELFKYKKNN